MSFADLREFMRLLEDRGQLRRVDAPVRRELEITEIADRLVKGPKGQNHALLFEHVEGAAMPVLINAFGTEERMAWALGVERLDELGEKIKGLLDLKMPGSLFEKFRKLGDLLDIARVGPKSSRAGPARRSSRLTGRPSPRSPSSGAGRRTRGTTSPSRWSSRATR
jgi:4-hydroxy-3-polyprenylbenzoate decarboxylase